MRWGHFSPLPRSWTGQKTSAVRRVTWLCASVCTQSIPECPTSHQHVTAITSTWAVAGQESNHRSVRGEPPSRYVIPGGMANRQVQRNSPRDGPALIERAAMAKGSVQIVVERCKACGFCVEFCPTHVLALSSAFNAKGYHTPYMVHPEKCSGCDLCGMYCPDFAIFGFKEPAPPKEATEDSHPSKGSLNGVPAPDGLQKEEQDAR